MDSIELSKKIGGKIEVVSKEKLSRGNLPILYTPGVADVSRAIAENHSLSFQYTIRKNCIAVISDGSAVLGLGNIGPEAALPVMEGKALLLKELANVDAFPIVLGTQDTEDVIKTIINISSTFGAINLEDISAPRCFEIEKRLKEELDIPVFHDDQHGTAIIVLAGLINALKIANKKIENIKIAISGAGAAGIAIAKLLTLYGAKNIILCDRNGSIYEGRDFGNNTTKEEIAKTTNPERIQGSIWEVIIGADVFIGVSAPEILKKGDIEKMADMPIVFALSNPIPEIMPNEAREGGAFIVASGRSDFSNQINNVLVFPGIFRGILDNKTKKIEDEDKIMAAKAIASLVNDPVADRIIPDIFDKRVVEEVAKVFRK